MLNREGMKNKTDITGMLARAGIRPTPVRILILRTLVDAARPLSAQEIETRLETVDRSSITRALTLFTEEHLVHVISDGTSSMKYEPCHSHCHDRLHTDEHVHFHCRMCGSTECLADTPIPTPPLPTGYRAENATFVISGLCPTCATRYNED